MVFILFKGRTDLKGIPIDIWGHGVQIGKKDHTRMVFRFLEGTSISNQSADAVFTFAVFQGHDSRYLLEQNVGYRVLGEQESAWLYEQTKQLHDLGVIIAYSGDQPFLLRLWMGISIDHVVTSEYQ